MIRGDNEYSTDESSAFEPSLDRVGERLPLQTAYCVDASPGLDTTSPLTRGGKSLRKIQAASRARSDSCINRKRIIRPHREVSL